MANGPYVKIPGSAKAGEIIAVKTKLKHAMETGWRKNSDGQTVPRKRIHKFVCTFNGAEVFRADLHSGVSADPYLMFPAKVTESGTTRWETLENRHSAGGEQPRRFKSVRNQNAAP